MKPQIQNTPRRKKQNKNKTQPKQNNRNHAMIANYIWKGTYIFQTLYLTYGNA